MTKDQLQHQLISVLQVLPDSVLQADRDSVRQAPADRVDHARDALFSVVKCAVSVQKKT
ncbi:MAG: hypothetical protein WCD00_14310 [Desulfuromonadaceae bacterium]